MTPAFEQWAYIANIVVAFLALSGAVKSAYNGVLWKAYQRLKLIEEINEQVHAMNDRQEALVDATVALAQSEKNENVEVNPSEVRERLDRVDDAQGYLDHTGDDATPGDD
jgi:hypothetical protein